MPEWLTITLALGGSALINTVVVFIFGRITGFFSNKKKEEKEDLLKGVEDIVSNQTKDLKKSDELVKSGLQALLRHELNSIYDTYVTKGYCPNEVKIDFENMYERYHSLGKNGVMDKKHETIINLPSVAEMISKEHEIEPTKEEILKANIDLEHKGE